MQENLQCPQCGSTVINYRNPAPTTDVIIYDPKHGVVLIERLNEPYGFALPGGFVDEGESVEHAAIREMQEETGLNVTIDGLLGVYSNPKRDPRRHTLSVVYVGKANNIEQLQAGDDAKKAQFFALDNLPQLVFDHAQMLQDFKDFLAGKRSLASINI